MNNKNDKTLNIIPTSCSLSSFTRSVGEARSIGGQRSPDSLGKSTESKRIGGHVYTTPALIPPMPPLFPNSKYKGKKSKHVYLTYVDPLKEPLIFSKKKRKGLKAIPLNVKISDIGHMRHFTPAAQEWRNSVYAYNKNYTKLLPAADSNLMSLVKSYFNFYFKKKKNNSKKKVYPKNSVIKGKKKGRGKHSITIRKRSIFRNLSAKKIFVARGDLKHTSSKAVITLYLYNTEKKFLIRNIKKQIFDLYRPNKPLIRRISMYRNYKEVISYNRPFSLKEYLRISDHYTDYITSFKMSFIEKLCKYFNLTTKLDNSIANLIETKVLNEGEKRRIFINKVNSFYNIKYPDYTDYMHKVKLHYINKLTLYLKLLILNQIKFKHAFLLNLRYLVSLVYAKDVEFNLVNLKKMHLNSDIFTQAVALKLKNRDNRLYRVLKSSLNKVKLPNVSRIKEKYIASGHLNKINKEQVLVYKMRNLKINSLFALDYSAKQYQSQAGVLHTSLPSISSKLDGHVYTAGLQNRAGEVNKDYLNKLLLNVFPGWWLSQAKVAKKEPIHKGAISLRNYIFGSLKHINMAGIRLEAKGRLTRRFTASRSVFKMRWKGGLKNVDSSFRGLSAVILRGHVKSNIQYSMLHSKNRNGAFGVKGWVSSK
jgi:Mitochondrial ribosomal protein (VAR1)